MGGFMLCKNGQPTQILTVDRLSWSFPTHDIKTTLIWNIQNGIVDPPRITEEDIKDQSKGDAISKTLIIVQTTWFVLQCITRWSQRLPVTELEVATLAFAMLNGVTYGLWWDKPQSVGRPVFLERKKPRRSIGIQSDSNTANDSVLSESDSRPPRSDPEKGSWLRQQLRQEMKEHAYSPTLLWRIPLQALQASLRPLAKIPNDGEFKKTRVGMFSSWNERRSETTYATAPIAALFGCVHLIPSSIFDFASPQGMWLWRASAIVITVIPMFAVFLFYFERVNRELLCGLFIIPMFLGLPIYIIARGILTTVTLTSLQSLPKIFSSTLLGLIQSL